MTAKWISCQSCGWYRPYQDPEPGWLVADQRIHKMDWPDHEGFVYSVEDKMNCEACGHPTESHVALGYHPDEAVRWCRQCQCRRFQ